MISAEAALHGFASALYETAEEPARVLIDYDASLRARGYVALTQASPDEVPLPVRACRLGKGQRLVAIAQPAGAGTLFSTLHSEDGGDVDLPLGDESQLERAPAGRARFAFHTLLPHDAWSMVESGASVSGLLLLLAHGCGLLALCVTIHAVTLVGLSRWLLANAANLAPSFAADLRLIIGATLALLLIHLFEILSWAVLYVWGDVLPDFQTAFYFSATTYTTVGYGDVLLPPRFRLYASAEALTGILLSGLSSGFLFAFLTRRFGARSSSSAPPSEHSPTQPNPADGLPRCASCLRPFSARESSSPDLR